MNRALPVLELGLALGAVVGLALLAQSRRRARRRAAEGIPEEPSRFKKLLDLLPEKVLEAGEQVTQKLVEFLRPVLSRIASALRDSIRKVTSSFLQKTEKSEKKEKSWKFSRKQTSPEKGA
ncbi:MAG: hypothetical protein LBD54_01375 [Puniceicoccales bacterium]|jgi:hypothetical protein|nr:hypothetical protein [Puniceicoccales bacterium]